MWHVSRRWIAQMANQGNQRRYAYPTGPAPARFTAGRFGKVRFGQGGKLNPYARCAMDRLLSLWATEGPQAP